MKKYDDNPDSDGTDFAHPAFWRGNDAAVAGMIGLLRRIKSGKETKVGKFANPELTELRDWIVDLRDNASSNRDNVLAELELEFKEWMKDYDNPILPVGQGEKAMIICVLKTISEFRKMGDRK